MKFSELNLHPILAKNLETIGFQDCTAIQDQAIPWLRQGKDLAGLAQTGTGKTGAFLIPLIDRVLKGMVPSEEIQASATVAFSEWKRRQFILILVPTRELAEQVYENAKVFVANTQLKCVSIYGGTAYDKQVAALKDGAEIVIATPGRLIDLYKEHLADLGLVRAVIFDEADRMFDMGFKDDMRFILRRIPRDRQFLVFSATLNFDVLNVAYEFGADPVEVNISRDQPKADNVKDEIVHLGFDEKPAYLLSLLKKVKPNQAIIFSNFKHNVDRVARFLTSNGVPAVGISSLLTQAQRNKVMAQFKGESDQNILVATDVAARGLDILGVDLVVNYELPDDPENYVHRIGRTGRAGQTGSAYSLVCDRDVDALQRIEEYLKHKLEAIWMDDSELVKDFKPFPRDESRKPMGAGGGSRRMGGGEGSKHRDRKPSGRHPDRSSGGAGGGGQNKRRDENSNSGSQNSNRPARPNREARPEREARTDQNRSANRSRPARSDSQKSAPNPRFAQQKRNDIKSTPASPPVASRPAKSGSASASATGRKSQRGQHSSRSSKEGAGISKTVSGFLKKLIGSK